MEKVFETPGILSYTLLIGIKKESYLSLIKVLDDLGCWYSCVRHVS